MKTANLIINRLFSDPTCHRTKRPPSASPFDQIWNQGDKNLNFLTLQRIAENLEIQSRFSKIPILISFMNYTVPDQHFKIPMLNLWMSWGNLCPNLNFTVENKMENSHKRRWSHFKRKINGWDIPFPKILRVCQWIGQNIFHWGEWNEPIKLIRECVTLKIKIYILVAAKRVWGHSKSIFTQNFKFSTCSPLFIPVHFTCRVLMNFFEW